LILIPAVNPVARLVGDDLAAWKHEDDELGAKGIATRKCYRAALRDGTVITSGEGNVYESNNRRRTSLLRMQSSDRRQLHGRWEEVIPLSAYGVVEDMFCASGRLV